MTEFGCKEPGCNEKVVYTRAEVSGALLKSPPWLHVERPIPIYLTCPMGHVHRYTITFTPTDGDASG